MNKIYNIIWCMRRQTWIVVGELSRANGKTKTVRRTSTKRKLVQLSMLGMLSASALLAPTAHAGDFNWTGAAGDNKLTTAGNWDTNSLPLISAPPHC
jgi:hypothetical protein